LAPYKKAFLDAGGTESEWESKILGIKADAARQQEVLASNITGQIKDKEVTSEEWLNSEHGLATTQTGGIIDFNNLYKVNTKKVPTTGDMTIGLDGQIYTVSARYASGKNSG
jgi:hypothetical protein